MPKKTTPEIKKYKIALSVNNEMFESETDNVKEALQEFKPSDFHTEVFLSITQGMSNFTRKLALPKAKKIFGDGEQLDVFLTNLLF